jgi:hypothetical protein
MAILDIRATQNSSNRAREPFGAISLLLGNQPRHVSSRTTGEPEIISLLKFVASVLGREEKPRLQIRLHSLSKLDAARKVWLRTHPIQKCFWHLLTVYHIVKSPANCFGLTRKDSIADRNLSGQTVSRAQGSFHVSHESIASMFTREMQPATVAALPKRAPSSHFI